MSMKACPARRIVRVHDCFHFKQNPFSHVHVIPLAGTCMCVCVWPKVPHPCVRVLQRPSKHVYVRMSSMLDCARLQTIVHTYIDVHVSL